MDDNDIKTIADVLKFYDQRFVGVLAASMSNSNKIPLAVPNEVRNSYTHLSRANKEGKGNPAYLDNVKLAYNHLKRACLDAYKLDVFYCAKRIEKTHKRKKNFRIMERELRGRRKELSVREGQKIPNAKLLDDYAELLNDYDKLETTLTSAPNEPRGFELRYLILVGIVGAIIGMILLAYFKDLI